MSSEFSKIIKTQAQRLGFSACGIAKAEPVEEKVAQAFKRWIANGNNADMHYLENYEDKRLDPRLLMEGVKSIVWHSIMPPPNEYLKKSHKSQPMPTAKTTTTL